MQGPRDSAAQELRGFAALLLRLARWYWTASARSRWVRLPRSELQHLQVTLHRRYLKLEQHRSAK